MDKLTHQKIRNLMTKEGVWEYATNFQTYTTREFINEIGINKFSDELKNLLISNVKRIQKYLDDRILEPITN